MNGRYEISKEVVPGVLREVVFTADNIEDIKHELSGYMVLDDLQPGELFKQYTVTDAKTGAVNLEVFS
ncbi:hypothetical protein [uncultured Methanobrevibacter sp.]|uniref:hypothetical protein n=1 Tax=uncultured Methanobrevibacter sp. TaxID=253161 RepID=UPI0025E90979|nr:hypothetical protein [uncultured Methanobrevibacter sp.]